MTVGRSRRSALGWALLGALTGAGGCEEWGLESACVHLEVEDAEAEDPQAEAPTSAHEDLPFFEALFFGGQRGPFAMREFDYRNVGPLGAQGQHPLRTRDPGSVYRKVGFEDALRIAEESDRWLIVRFGTEWSDPTRYLDRAMNTPLVMEWVAANAFAIAVDVEAEREVARSQDVLWIPTLVLYRDGEEWASSSGYLPNTDVLTWIVTATSGPCDSRERWEPPAADDDHAVAARAPPSGPVWEAKSRAYHAQQEGRYDEALTEILWLWREGAEVDPSYRGVRVSFAATDMQALARRHPPALEAFEALRVEAREVVLAGGADADDVRDWFVLSRVVDREHRILAWYDSERDAQGRLPPAFANVTPPLVDLLLKHGRRADAGRLLDDVEERVAMLIDAWPTAWRPDSILHDVRLDGDYTTIRMFRGHVRDELAALHGTLLAAKRWEDAGRVAEALLGELDDAPTRARLVEEAMAVRVVLPCHERWLDEARRTHGPSAGSGPYDGGSDPCPDLRLLQSRLGMVKASILDETGPP